MVKIFTDLMRKTKDTSQTKYLDQKSLPNSKIRSGCSEISLFEWIEFCVTGIGDFDHEWVIDEYAEVSKDAKLNQSLRLKIKIATLNNRLIMIEMCVHHIAIVDHPEVVDFLRNKLGFHDIKFDNLEKDLQRVLNKAKSDLVKLKVAEAELEKLNADKGKAATREDYYNELGILEKWAGFSINPKEYSLMQYLVLRNLYKAENGRQFDKN